MKKEFNCSMEEMPTIADFVLASLTRDLADFTAYSPLFTEEYLTNFEAKREIATELILTDSENIRLKAISFKLYEEIKKMRMKLVRIEGYLNLAKKDLTGDRLGLKKLRLHLNNKNVEGVVVNGRGFVQNLLDNKTILMEKGLKQEQIDNLTTLIDTMETLNKEQNLLQSKRAENCLKNRDIFNNLWAFLRPVMQAGKAIYKGVNESKLNDYTMTRLKKRMNNERKAASNTPEPPAEPIK